MRSPRLGRKTAPVLAPDQSPLPSRASIAFRRLAGTPNLLAAASISWNTVGSLANWPKDGFWLTLPPIHPPPVLTAPVSKENSSGYCSSSQRWMPVSMILLV